MLLAVLYTTPWDNYLVFRQVWGYPPGRVLFTIGYVPFEEYLFFILQTLLSGLIFFALARRVSLTEDFELKRQLSARIAAVVIALLIAAAGLLALIQEPATYLGLILVWAMPVIALQWGFGGDLIMQRWRLVLLATAVPTLYLWLADRIAIALNIWWIGPELTTGLKLFGLPIEEALFFLLTNIFVVFGLTLVTHPVALVRFKDLRQLINLSWWQLTFILWALSMIPTPLFPDAFLPLAYLSTALLALATLGYALKAYGRRAILLFLAAFAFGLTIEWLGKTTGLPFGSYRYTAPGPALLGVTLLVPLGWWAFTLIALAVAPNKKLFLAPLALVAWDLGLDPLMVSKGFWVFEQGVYYGVPLLNFFGWYFAGLLLVALLFRLEPRLKNEQSLELRLTFFAQSFLMTTGLLFFGLNWAALITFVAMGIFAFPALVKLSPRRRFYQAK